MSSSSNESFENGIYYSFEGIRGGSKFNGESGSILDGNQHF